MYDKLCKLSLAVLIGRSTLCDAVTLLHETRELYKNRVDKLLERHCDYMTEWTTEKFDRGRARHLQGINILHEVVSTTLCLQKSFHL